MKTEVVFSFEVGSPTFADVTESLGLLTGFLRDHALDDDVWLGEFELAAAEAMNNAVEHGNAALPSGFMRGRLSMSPEIVELSVGDPSGFRGFEKLPELPADPLAEGGRGAFLMAQLTDEVYHRLVADGHEVVLRKRLPISAGGYLPGRNAQTLVEMTDELMASYEMISSLLGLGEWLAVAPDSEAFASGALQRLCEVTGADFAYARFEHKGGLQLLSQSGKALLEPPETIDVDRMAIEAEVFRSGGEKTLTRGMALPPDEPLAGVMTQGFVAPILFKDSRRGVLVMGSTKEAEFFDAGRLKIARMLSEYLGIAVMMAELQQRRVDSERDMRDLEIAAKIQLSLMPSEFSAIEGLDIHGVCRPARQAGGDYFEVMRLPDGAVICAIADVMGKGLPAALLAAMLRTTLRGIVAEGWHDPGEILTRANRLLIEDLTALGMFITIACVWISPDRKKIRYSSAGHPAPRLQDMRGGLLDLDPAAGGLPAGIMADTIYPSAETSMEKGTRLLLYTDGFSEAVAADGTFFGTHGIDQSLCSTVGLGSRETLEQTLSATDAFTGHADPSDDRTAVLLCRTK